MKFKNIEEKNKRLVFLSGIALIILAVLCSYMIIENLEYIWPTDDILFEQKQKCKRLKRELQEKQVKYESILRKEEKILAKTKRFYKLNDDEKADSYMRQQIEHAGKFSNVIIKSMSSVKKKVIKDGIFSLDISISAEGNFEKIVNFCQELNKKEVCFYWVSCYMRPTRSKDETLISLSGSLRIICMKDGILSPEKDKITKKKKAAVK